MNSSDYDNYRETERPLRVLITGSSKGIGRAAALKYLAEGCSVVGFDILPASIDDESYTHFCIDVTNPDAFPQMCGEGNDDFSEKAQGTDFATGLHATPPADFANPNSAVHSQVCPSSPCSSSPSIDPPNIIFICAGTQNSTDDISTNLKGAINIVEKYAFHPEIRSVLFCASASARTGFEFPEYVASKAGLVGYMKNVAVRLAPYGATANSVSPGGVVTDSNAPVMNDPALWSKIMDATPLKKWATEQEIAEWVWFLTVVNRSASGTDLLVDNGETNLNSTFVWPEQKYL